MIYEFVERHERRRLRKHASRGNINGMENFLDIFTALVRLLYVYYKRDVVKKGQFVRRACTLVEIAMIRSEREEDRFDGYLASIYENLEGDKKLLQEVCAATNYLAEVRDTLLILQDARFDPNEEPRAGPKATRPREMLPTCANAVRSTIADCGLVEPAADAIRKALDDYRMLSEGEIKRLLAELPG